MEKFPVKVGLHQGSALSPYLFNLIMDVISAEVRDEAPLSMLFADDIILSSSQHEIVEKKLEEWRNVMEERGLKISRRKTEHLQYNKEGDGCIRLQGQELNQVKKFSYWGQCWQRTVNSMLMYISGSKPVGKIGGNCQEFCVIESYHQG